jgi:hypothetical protein
MRTTSATATLVSLLMAGLLTVAPAAAATRATTGSADPAAAVATLAPRAGASEESRSIAYRFPPQTEMEAGDLAQAHIEVATTQPTVVRLQQEIADTWVDVEAAAVPTGGFVRDFAVPTAEPGTVRLRFALDADAVFPAYSTPVYSYNVTAPPPPPVVKDPSTITLTGPGTSTVSVGKAVTVSGRVGGLTPARRTVRLELDTRRGWMGLATATTRSTGEYTMHVPTDWYYAGTLRTRVLATDTDAAAVAPRTFPLQVRPTYRPGGHASQWNLLSGDSRVRWNPCRTITYRVNLTGAPPHMLTQVKQAFAQVHAATGLTFAYDGATTAIPYRTDGGRRRSGADLTLGFGSERQVRDLRGWTIGLGGWMHASGNEIQEGAVVLDRDARLRSGFGRGATWGSLLLHEIGHAMNLGHALERNEVMHSGLGSFSPGHYQAGDLNGLARMGAMGGCVGGGDAAPARLGAPTWHVAS